jgi:mRNA interferase RelE/StbE
MHKVLFPNHARERDFEKQISKLSKENQEAVMVAIENLAHEPRPSGVPKLRPPIAVGQDLAQYRIRIGNYRVLYDIDDKRKIVWILDVRLRSEKTYR